jgi:hypothetical protein
MHKLSLIIRGAALGALAILSGTTASALPFVLEPTPNLPPLDAFYGSLSHVPIGFAGGQILVTDVKHFNFSNSFAPPPLFGSTTHSFGSTVNMRVSLDFGATFTRFSASGNVTVRVDSTGDVGNTRSFDTEMLQLDIFGGNLPPGVMIRESPTLTSMGETTITDVGGGEFSITSFFDIFTELSVDGGQTWMPAQTGPHTVVAQPIPDSGSTFLLLLIPALALVWCSRALGKSHAI